MYLAYRLCIKSRVSREQQISLEKKKKKKNPSQVQTFTLGGKRQSEKNKEKKKNRVMKKKWRQVFGSTVFRKAK
jgi:hypothetical protein